MILNERYPATDYFTTRYAHNFFLQMASDAGIFGLIGSILLVGSVFWQAYQVIQRKILKREKLFFIALYVGLLASFINNLADFDWQLPSILTLFWLLIGLIN